MPSPYFYKIYPLNASSTFFDPSLICIKLKINSLSVLCKCSSSDYSLKTLKRAQLAFET